MSIGLTRQQVPLSVPYIWFVFLNCAVIVGILAVFCAGVVSVAGVEIDYRLMLLTVAAAVSLAITEIGRRLCLLQGYGLTALSCEVLRWALSLGISCVLVTEHIFGVVLSALFAFFFANIVVTGVMLIALRSVFAAGSIRSNIVAIKSVHSEFVRWAALSVLIRALISRAPCL